MKDLVIDFDKLAENAKTAPNDLLRVFKKAGAELAGSWVGKMKREQGISYKPITLVFADSQEVELRVKRTGDIYAVRLNGKLTPIKEQDDQKKAIAEIVTAVEGNSKRYQALLVRKKVELPPDIKTTLAVKEEAVKDRKTELLEAIAEIEKEIEGLKTELTELEAA